MALPSWMVNNLNAAAAPGAANTYMNGLRPWSLGSAAGQEYGAPSAAQLAYQQAFAPYGSWQNGTFVPSVGTSAGGGGSGGAAAGAQQAAQGNQLNSISGAQQGIIGATYGQAQAIANDPYTNGVLQFLQGVQNGQTVPYTPTAINAMLSQVDQGAAASQAQQAQAALQNYAANGGNPSDPAFQAQLNALQQARQSANLNALGQINQNAALANFNAQMQGANNLASTRSAQNAQVNQLGLAGAGYSAQVHQPQAGGGSIAPIMNPYGFMGGGGGNGGGGGDFNPFGSAPIGTPFASPSQGVSVGGGGGSSGPSGPASSGNVGSGVGLVGAPGSVIQSTPGQGTSVAGGAAVAGGNAGANVGSMGTGTPLQFGTPAAGFGGQPTSYPSFGQLQSGGFIPQFFSGGN